MALQQGMRATYDTVVHPVLQMLARANRERLAVLLEEARSGAGGNERYAACLRWDICLSLRVSQVWLSLTGSQISSPESDVAEFYGFGIIVAGVSRWT